MGKYLNDQESNSLLLASEKENSSKHWDYVAEEKNKKTLSPTKTQLFLSKNFTKIYSCKLKTHL